MWIKSSVQYVKSKDLFIYKPYGIREYYVIVTVYEICPYVTVKLICIYKYLATLN